MKWYKKFVENKSPQIKFCHSNRDGKVGELVTESIDDLI